MPANNSPVRYTFPSIPALKHLSTMLLHVGLHHRWVEQSILNVGCHLAALRSLKHAHSQFRASALKRLQEIVSNESIFGQMNLKTERKTVESYGEGKLRL